MERFIETVNMNLKTRYQVYVQEVSRRHIYEHTLNTNDSEKEAVEWVMGFYDDPEEKSQFQLILGIDKFDLSFSGIDYSLKRNMDAVKSICELGRKVKAEAGLRRIQPLNVCYVYVNDYLTRKDLIYCQKNDEMSGLISDELIVGQVVFVDDVDDIPLFDVGLKPNFKTLGKRFGKKVQELKTELSKLSIEESNSLYAKLKSGQTIESFCIPITFADVEIVTSAKEGLATAKNDVATIIIDTKVTPFLEKKRKALEVRRLISLARQEGKLQVHDCIDEIVVHTSSDLTKEAVENWWGPYLKREGRSNNISIVTSSEETEDRVELKL